MLHTLFSFQFVVLLALAIIILMMVIPISQAAKVIIGCVTIGFLVVAMIFVLGG